MIGTIIQINRHLCSRLLMKRQWFNIVQRRKIIMDHKNNQSCVHNTQFPLLEILLTLIFFLALLVFCEGPGLWGLLYFCVMIYKTVAKPMVVIMAPEPSPAASNNLSMETRGFKAITFVLTPVVGWGQKHSTLPFFWRGNKQQYSVNIYIGYKSMTT